MCPVHVHQLPLLAPPFLTPLAHLPCTFSTSRASTLILLCLELFPVAPRHWLFAISHRGMGLKHRVVLHVLPGTVVWLGHVDGLLVCWLQA